MVNDFLDNKFGNMTKYNSNNEKFREDQLFQRFIFAYVLIMAHNVGSIISTYVDKLPDPTIYIVLISTCTGILTIFFFLVIFNKKVKKLLNIFKCIIFFIPYAIQLYSFYNYMDLPNFIIQNIYTTYLLTLILLIFLLRFNFIVIIIVSVINLIPSIILFSEKHIKSDKYSNNSINCSFIHEIFYGIISPIASFFIRYQYSQIIKKVNENLEKLKNVLAYTTNLIKYHSNCIVMVSNSKIIYQNISYGHLNEKINNEDAEITKDFLEESKIKYINGEFNQFIKIGEEINVFTLLCRIEKEFDAEENHYYKLGMIFYHSEYHCLFYQLSFRKINYEKGTWLEVTLNDVTAAQNIEALEQMTKMKEVILEKIAHDLKTPLICILGTCDEIKTEPNSLDENNSKITQISDLINYTMYLMDDIIHFMKNNKLKQNYLFNTEMLKKKTVNMSKNLFNVKIYEILEFSFRMLNTLLSLKKKNVTAIKSTNLPESFTIKTDPVRLKQIILNLINSAVSLIKNGTIQLKSKIKHNELFISVKDKGSIKNNAESNKNINSNSNVNNNSNNNDKDSMNGFSICQNLCKLLGYKFESKNNFNTGTKYTIIIPLNHNHNKNDFLNRTFHNTNALNEELGSLILDNLSQQCLTVENFNQKERSTIKKQQTGSSIPISSSLTNTLLCNTLDCKSINRIKAHLNSLSSQTHDNINIANDDILLKIPSKNITSKAKILIIDDNQLILKSISNQLQKILNGYHLEFEIVTGIDGIDLLKFLMDDQRNENLIKLAFVDENMDYMNGSEAIRIMRRFEKELKFNRIFICKISSDNQVFQDDSDIEMFINKPISDLDILNVLINSNLV